MLTPCGLCLGAGWFWENLMERMPRYLDTVTPHISQPVFKFLVHLLCVLFRCKACVAEPAPQVDGFSGPVNLHRTFTVKALHFSCHDTGFLWHLFSRCCVVPEPVTGDCKRRMPAAGSGMLVQLKNNHLIYYGFAVVSVNSRCITSDRTWSKSNQPRSGRGERGSAI